ncbi:unnamed protein product [marine sediment metagenome]|uniref:Uncharacterized protein n=1 Tax=marine sediment metagenome TaxID=412755 RepID=X1C7F7_9ZZZZ
MYEPNLSTIRMIEKAIRDRNGELTRTELWKSLPKKTKYQTFKQALDYLIESVKVILKDNKLIWIFDPEMVELLMKRSVPV